MKDPWVLLHSQNIPTDKNSTWYSGKSNNNRQQPIYRNQVNREEDRMHLHHRLLTLIVDWNIYTIQSCNSHNPARFLILDAQREYVILLDNFLRIKPNGIELNNRVTDLHQNAFR